MGSIINHSLKCDTNLIFDIFKGWAAVKLIYFTNLYLPGTGDYINLQLGLFLFNLEMKIYPCLFGPYL